MRDMTQVIPTTDTQEKRTMHMDKNRPVLRRTRASAMWTASLSLPLVAACDIQEILEVDIPGRVEEPRWTIRGWCQRWSRA